MINIILTQVLCTALLLVCALAVTDQSNAGAPPGVFPFAMGMLVTVHIAAVGFIGGNAINPARDLGPRIYTALAGWGSEVFRYKVKKW